VVLLSKSLPLLVVFDKHDVLESSSMLVPFLSELVHVVLEPSVVLVENVYQVRICIALRLPIDYVLLDQRQLLCKVLEIQADMR
jgi:hypothetical protein